MFSFTVKPVTYFVPEEGFLAGLALNNENVTFNEGYKKILRFYGFDLDHDQLPTLAPTNGTNATTTSAPENPTEATTAMPSDSMPAREETTPNPNAETISTFVSSTTLNPSAPNAESTTSMPTTTEQITTQNSITETTTLQQTTTSVQETTTVTPEQTTTTVMETTKPASSPANPETTISTTTSDVETIASSLPPTPTAALTEEPADNNEVEVLTTPDTSNSAGTSTLIDSSSVSTTAETTTSEIITSTEITTTATSESGQTETITSTTVMPTTEPDPTTALNESTLETLERKKKSIVDFIFTNPPYVDDYLIYRSYDIPIPGTGFDSTMFLANGLKNVQVSYMHYNTVLEHAYLPHLEACALRLPLDSERYYLLVVLPNRPGIAELGRLLSRMARESDLSDVYAALRPRRVRAIVPSFTVKGHVTLTTDLQKLGIRDVFEPRQHDFSPMTHQPGVYVRSIEQAVSVAIRKYQPDDNKKNRYVTNRQPITFSATYPFLYFVMDSSIHVALMAGKMVDPLNNRIL